MIILKADRFKEQYNGDYDVLFEAATVFLVLATLGAVMLQLIVITGEMNSRLVMTGFMFILEDFPQLIIQGIYFDTVGFDSGDTLALWTLIITVGSCCYGLALLCLTFYAGGEVDEVFSM